MNDPRMIEAQSLTARLGGKWHRRYGVAPCPVCQPERRKDQDALTLAFRVGQAHFDDFAKLTSPSLPATTRFVSGLLTEAFGFQDIAQDALPIALSAGTGRVPVVVVPPSDSIDRRSAILRSFARW